MARRTYLSSLAALALLAGVATSPGAAHADGDERPLGIVEARFAAGLATGGGSGIAVLRRAPLSLTVTADVAATVEPWTSFYGGLWIEHDARAGVGAVGGIRLRPGDSGKWRVSAGGAAIAVPYTLYGATAALGRCGHPLGGAAFLCVDTEVAAFFAGDDLPAGRTAGHVLLALGVGFDAW
jgi:hypothetical protein